MRLVLSLSMCVLLMLHSIGSVYGAPNQNSNSTNTNNANTNNTNTNNTNTNTITINTNTNNSNTTNPNTTGITQNAPTQAELIRAQQEQIRLRAKEIEDRALADKSMKERDDRKKAEELREKQWIEEYPNVPFPRSTPSYPAQQRQAAPYAPQVPIQNQSSGELSNQMTIIQQLNDISQRLARIESIMNNRANNNENQQKYNGSNYNQKDTRLINQQIIDQKNLENRLSIENNYYINVAGEPKIK